MHRPDWAWSPCVPVGPGGEMVPLYASGCNDSAPLTQEQRQRPAITSTAASNSKNLPTATPDPHDVQATRSRAAEQDLAAATAKAKFINPPGGHSQLIRGPRKPGRSDRAQMEIDRARQESKALRAELASAKRAHTKALMDLDRERRTLQRALREAEAGAARHAGHVAALETTLARLQVVAPSAKKPRPPRRRNG